MKFYPSLRKHLAYPSAFLVLSLFPAQAFEAGALTDRLKTVLADQGVQLGWDGVTASGTKVVLEGANIKVAGEPQPIVIGTVTLDDISDQNGGYRIGKITFPSYSFSENGMNVEIAAGELSGVTVPSPAAMDTLSSLMMYESADLAQISIKSGGAEVFNLSNLHFEMTPPKDGEALEFAGSAEKFTADLASAATDAESRKAIEALGYGTISGYFEMSGSWHPGDGQLELAQYDLSVDNAGTLGISLALGGYTLDFVKSLQELQKKMAAQPAGADDSAQGLAMLGLMQQLTFNNASVRFDDDSLTNKLLEFYAKQQGVKPSDLANQAKAILPFLLAQLDNPELTAQISSAVATYLDEPSSLEIAAAPEKPVPFSLIMAGAMQSPKDLTKTLAVSVTANEE